jgi:hypothetical protein
VHLTFSRPWPLPLLSSSPCLLCSALLCFAPHRIFSVRTKPNPIEALDDVVCMKEPHDKRRQRLNSLVEPIPGRAEIGSREKINFSSARAPEFLEQAFARAITAGCSEPNTPAVQATAFGLAGGLVGQAVVTTFSIRKYLGGELLGSKNGMKLIRN